MPRVSDMKERLTEAAMDLIWENSYGATSIDAICERAGAKKGSFYYFFKSKSELAAAALEGDWKKRKADMDTIFSATVPPLERFERYFDYVHDRLAEVQKKCGSILGFPLGDTGASPHSQRPGTGAGIQIFGSRYSRGHSRRCCVQTLIIFLSTLKTTSQL